MPRKIVAGYILHLMRFIEDHGRIFRQDAAEVVLLQRQIREEEVMVHDNQVGFLRPLVHSRHKARVERRAFLPRASVAPCVQASPQFRIIRQERQLRAIARLRQLGPILDLPKIIHFLDALKQRLVLHLVQLRNAQKIRPPLHQCGFQVRRKMFLQKRNIFLEQLLLQRFRCRGDHHTTSARDRRNQVGERLARPGAGLHDRVMMRFERIVY